MPTTAKRTPSAQYAVLTGDIVDSTKLTAINRKKLIELLNGFFSKLNVKTRNNLQLKVSFEIYRGDSFQGVLDNPNDALLVALLIRSYLQGKVVFPKQATKTDARIAIGLGKITYRAKTLAESDGEAFVFSGRLLDSMKKLPNRIAIQSGRKVLNDEMETNLVLLEAIVNKWTAAQAEVVYYKLMNYTEVAIAEILNIKQPTVNERSKAASWVAIDRLVKRYQQLTIKKSK